MSAREYLTSLFLPKDARPWLWTEWVQLALLLVGFALIPWFCSFIPLGSGSRSMTGSKHDDLFYLGLWLSLCSIALMLYNLKYDRGKSTVYFHLCAAPVVFLIYWMGLAYWINGPYFYITHDLNYMNVDLHPPQIVEPWYTFFVLVFNGSFYYSPVPYLVILGSLLLLRHGKTRRDGIACLAMIAGGAVIYFLALPQYFDWLMD